MIIKSKKKYELNQPRNSWRTELSTSFVESGAGVLTFLLTGVQDEMLFIVFFDSEVKMISVDGWKV